MNVKIVKGLVCLVYISVSALAFSQVPGINPQIQQINPQKTASYLSAAAQNSVLVINHTVTGGNTVNGISIIRTEQFAGMTNPVIIATAVHGRSGKAFYNKNILLRRFNNGEWGIDVNNPATPGASFNNVDFNLLVSKANDYAFLHTAAQPNILAYQTKLNHPLLNGNPDAKFLVTQIQVDGVKNDNPCGITYQGGYWYIMNLNKNPMPAGARYNVIISPKIVTVTVNNPLAHYWAINDKRIPRNNPEASVYTTQVVNSGVLNPNEISVSWTKKPPPANQAVTNNSSAGYWGLMNQNKKPLPANTTVNILVMQNGESSANSGYVQAPLPLTGIVDMHTHLMSHLGFSGVALHGVPDVGSLIPKGSYYTGSGCNSDTIRSTSVAMSLGSCNASHGGWGTDNPCGDYLRMALVSVALDGGFDDVADLDHPHAGYPEFASWPHHSSILHQQMWWGWVKRAWQGGMRVMVVLTVNNELLAEGLNGPNPKTDKAVADLQIKETKKFVERHSDFIEIAYSPEDLRRIVKAGKLAFILGMEVDNLGDFNKPGVLCDETTVRAEIQRLYGLGIRYIFPIHLTNNKFGGSAVYSWIFNLSNKYNTGSMFNVTTSPDPGVKFSYYLTPIYFLENQTIMSIRALLENVGMLPVPIGLCDGPVINTCGSYRKVLDLMVPDLKIDQYKFISSGQVNSLGMTPLGEIAIKEMMRLGMMIDIDHMSEKSQWSAIQIAETMEGGYPLNMGHNGVRCFQKGNCKERSAPPAMITRISKLSGMFGIGTSHMSVMDFVRESNEALKFTGKIALGTDANGFEPLPHRYQHRRDNSRTGESNLFYNAFFADRDFGLTTKSQMGLRVWDYVKEGGVSHYGLIPEFLFDVKNTHDQDPTKLPGAQIFNQLRNSAENFAQMWERCVRVSPLVR